MNTKEELEKRFDLAAKKKLLQQMQQPTEYQLTELSEEDLSQWSLRRIPGFNRFVSKDEDSTSPAPYEQKTDRLRLKEDVDKVATNAEKLGSSSAGLSHVTGGLAIGADSVDLVSQTMLLGVYLFAYLSGKKLPFTLDDRLKMSFAGVGIALGITGFAVPAVAPILGLVGAGLGLGVSAYWLGKTIYDRRRLAQQIKHVKEELERQDIEISKLRIEARTLANRLNEVQTEGQARDLSVETIDLEQRYMKQKAFVQTLKNEQLHLEQKLSQIHPMQVAFRSISVALAAVAVIGLVASLFSPVGPFILGGVAIAAVIHLGIQFALPRLKSSKKTNNLAIEKKQLAEDTADAHLTESLTQHLDKRKDLTLKEDEAPAFRSTTRMMMELKEAEEKPAVTIDQEESSVEEDEDVASESIPPPKPAPLPIPPSHENKEEEQDDEEEDELMR